MVSEISVLHEGHGHDEGNQQNIGMDGHEGLVGLHVVLTRQEEPYADQGKHQQCQVDVVQSKADINLRVVNPSLPLRNCLNLAESHIEESLIKRKRFGEVNSVVTLSSNSSSAGEPEENRCVNSDLENETRNSAHELVIRVCCFLELLSSHPISPGKYKLSNVVEHVSESHDETLSAREVKDLLLQRLHTTKVN